MSLAAKIYDGRGAYLYDRAADTNAPTYDLRANFDAMMPAADYRDVLLTQDGDLALTIDLIVKRIKEYSFQVKRLAKFLKANTARQSAYNVWRFVKENVAYALDEAGKEQLRTPARSWADRYTGVDCDDFAIFGASLLKEMGYSPTLVIVGFEGRDDYSHIYLELKDGAQTYVIDDVMANFDVEPEKVARKKKRGITIELLSGIAKGDDGYLSGAAADDDEVGEAQVALWVKLMNKTLPATRAAAVAEKIAPMIDRFDAKGNPVPIDGDYDTFLQAVALVLAESQGLQGARISDDIAVFDIPGAAGLGRRSKAEREERKRRRKEKWQAFKEKVKTSFKKAGEKIKQFAKDAWKFVKKFNPLSVAGRNAFLLVVKLNFRGLATKLARAYESGNDAKRNKLETLWTKLGGNVESLKKNINEGKTKKAIFGMPKSEGRPRDPRLKGDDGLGVEPVATATGTLALAASTIVAALKPVLDMLRKKDEPGEFESAAAEAAAQQEAQNLTDVESPPGEGGAPISIVPGESAPGGTRLSDGDFMTALEKAAAAGEAGAAEALAKVKKESIKTAVYFGVGGGLVGAAAGFMLTKGKPKKMRNALIGGVAAGAAGAGGGYYYGRNEALKTARTQST